MTLTASRTRIDVRTIAPSERHALIFSSFAALGTGESLELVNDHNPAPLHHQFDARLPDQFTWDYLDRGPDLWRVERQSGHQTDCLGEPAHGAPPATEGADLHPVR